MLRYLFVFAWRDLTDRAAWRSTRVIGQTIALVCALTVALFGFVYGSARVGYERLRQDPLARCLWVGDTQQALLSAKVVGEIEDKVRQEVSSPRALEGVFPFYQVTLRLRGSKGDVPAPQIGRTFVLEGDGESQRRDPLLLSRPLLPGGPGFAGPDDEGIILTPRALRELGFPVTAPPATIPLVRAGGPDLVVPVLGALEKDLPTPHAFLILPAYERRLSGRDPDPELAEITTTPLPAGWPRTIDELPKAVLELLRDGAWDQGDPVVKERGDQITWSILHNRWADDDVRKPALSLWSGRLQAVQRAMAAAGYPAKVPLRVDLSGVRQDELPPVTTYHMAAVYLRDVEELPRAADACEKVLADGAKVPLDRWVVDQVARVAEQTTLALGVLALIQFVVLLIAISNLRALQSLRAEGRTAEVGMLKAMGMTGRSLVLLELIEGTLLWLPAALLGLAIGLGLQYVACAWWYRKAPEEVAIGFYWSWRLLVGVLVGSGLISLACGLIASNRARRASPSESLRASG